MNNPRDFGPTPQDGAPTMAAPAAGQQPGAWPQQAPYGGPGAYQPYGQPPPPDMYYSQQPPAPIPAPTQLPVYKRPAVVFGVAAVAATVAVGALLATWVTKDSVSTTPANTTGTPSQQVQVPLAPAPPSAPAPSQSVIVQQPAPRQQAPRQQAPAPANPSVAGPAPVSPNSPVPEPNPNPNPVPDPVPEEKQDPVPPPEDPGDFKDPETGADTRGKADTPPPVDKHNPGAPANETPEDTLCHPNPPGCTGDQKAQPAP